jgi:hypothetical protein
MPSSAILAPASRAQGGSLAGPIVFLASDLARCVTGAAFVNLK